MLKRHGIESGPDLGSIKNRGVDFTARRITQRIAKNFHFATSYARNFSQSPKAKHRADRGNKCGADEVF